MLILQRKAGESILIGEDISISILSVKKGQVRLAISAPVEVPILRSELVAAIAANRDSATEESDPAALLSLLSGAVGEGPQSEPQELNMEKGEKNI